MRNLVLASAAFLAIGILVEAVVQTASFGFPSAVPALLSAIAAFSVLFAATLLVSTFLISLLPGVSRRLRQCRH
jgi:hypothetical protein